MTDSVERTEAQEYQTSVISDLDNTGGLFRGLAAVLAFADEQGHDVHAAKDHMDDADIYLNEAFHAADTADADPDGVSDKVRNANVSMRRMRAELPEEVREMECPDYADTGAYDTVGDYAEYVAAFVGAIAQDTVEWSVAAEE